MSDIKSIASSTRQFNQRFISQASVNVKLHHRPASRVDWSLCACITDVVRFYCQNSSLLWSTEDGAHAPESLTTFSNYKPHQTHYVFNRSASHCLLVEPVGKYSSSTGPPLAPPSLHHISEPVLSGCIYPAAKYLIFQILVAYLMFRSGCLWSRIFTYSLTLLCSSSNGSILDLYIDFLKKQLPIFLLVVICLCATSKRDMLLQRIRLIITICLEVSELIFSSWLHCLWSL